MAYAQSLSFSALSCYSHKKGMRKRLIYRVRCENDNTSYGRSSEKKLKVLIAGGGIAGLVFALAAKRSGFDVKVFEKDLTAVRGEGWDRGPIQLLSNALGLLDSIDKDVTREIMEAGFAIGDRKYGIADGRTGDWFVMFDFLTPAISKGIPVTQIIYRMELQRILVSAIGDGIVINNFKVVDFESNPHKVWSFIGNDKVTVLLENGAEHEGDVLIGCDGMRSIVRSKLFGSGGLTYSNFTCYTGVAEFHSTYIPPSAFKNFMGTNQYFVALDIGKGRMQWYAFLREDKESPVPSIGNKNMLLERFGSWCEEVLVLIMTTEEEMIIRRPIYDTDMMSRWGKDRVILLGDAAHAMLPNLGQGGSMAIEDCYWLMLELQKLVEMNPFTKISCQDLEMAFRRFEKQRMFRVGTLHSISRMASFMTSFYKRYIDIGPMPLLNPATIRIKHPVFRVTDKPLQVALPKFMDWVAVGQE